jgi:hypothetical protein
MIEAISNMFLCQRSLHGDCRGTKAGRHDVRVRFTRPKFILSVDVALVRTLEEQSHTF